MKILICIGTRPELIKMYAIINKLKKSSKVECYVCLSGQHRELTTNICKELGINVDFNLDIMKSKQTLQYVLSAIINKLQLVLNELQPDFIIVHGDTTTCFASAICSFYNKIPIIYVEAGLRSQNNYEPFPEEMHRQLVTKLANYFLCTSTNNRKTLLLEGINKRNIFVIGNPISDVLKESILTNYIFAEGILNKIVKKSCVVVTCHRRENRDKISKLYNILRDVAKEKKDVEIAWIGHPSIKDICIDLFSKDSAIGNFNFLQPIGVADMHNLIFRAKVVLTDSGGVQEEASFLGKPTLILREVTEREELLNDFSCLVGFDLDIIKEKINYYLNLEETCLFTHNIGLTYSVGERACKVIEEICEKKYE